MTSFYIPITPSNQRLPELASTDKDQAWDNLVQANSKLKRTKEDLISLGYIVGKVNENIKYTPSKGS